MNKYVVEFLGTLFFLYVILATGQALAIGLALTNSAMTPATYEERDSYAVESGRAVMHLIEKNIKRF